ncbi:MAG: tRNA lysidine(34) synthetase TilS [Methylophilaceae bacterium]
MANSKKLLRSKQNAFSHDTSLFLTKVFLSQQLVNPHLLLAFSGGLDSAMLLHLLAHLQTELDFKLSVMHVHHGLSTNADAWAAFCQKTCADLKVPFKLHKVQIDYNSGLGIEATARQARYQALMSAESDFVCLAHHQNDQAETLLLQLARGAGVKGLAGMAPVDIERKLLRPLLHFSRIEIASYAKHHHLHWIEDESNNNTRHDRNFMRHAVLPTIDERYPAITQTLGRSAMHLADASQLLDELAAIDALKALDDTESQQRLNLTILKNLSATRQANLIRWWLAQYQINMPSTLLLQQILQQMLHAKSDAAVKIKLSEARYLMRYQSWAYLVSEPVMSVPINLLWQGEEVIILPNLSRLLFSQKIGEGLALERGGSLIKLRIKSREGGERFKPVLGRPSRTLKYVLQASEMPPWLREQLPLVFVDETLAVIPNIGVDAHLKAASHEMGLSVSWQLN